MSADEPSDPRGGASPMTRGPHLWDINWVRDLVYLSVLIAIVWAALWLRAIVQPVLLAALFAYLIHPIIDWCGERWHWSRLVSLCVLLGSAALILLGLGVLTVPVALSQAEELIRKLPDYVQSLAVRFGIRDDEMLEKLREKGAAFAQDPISNLSYVWDGVVTSFGVLSGVLGTATSLAMGVALFPIYLFFFSWKWPEIAAWPAPFIPASRRDRVLEVAGMMDQAVGDYFRTRLIIALIMGVMYSLGWGVAGVPYWLLVGMLGGLLGIIPYAATFAWLAAMLLQYLELENGISGTSDALRVFLWPSIVYGIVQASDDWVLTPWLQGRQFDMSFVTIVLAVLIGGAVAGLLGMLLAVPAAACVRILWAEVIRPALVAYAKTH